MRANGPEGYDEMLSDSSEFSALQGNVDRDHPAARYNQYCGFSDCIGVMQLVCNIERAHESSEQG